MYKNCDIRKDFFIVFVLQNSLKKVKNILSNYIVFLFPIKCRARKSGGGIARPQPSSTVEEFLFCVLRSYQDVINNLNQLSLITVPAHMKLLSSLLKNTFHIFALCWKLLPQEDDDRFGWLWTDVKTSQHVNKAWKLYWSSLKPPLWFLRLSAEVNHE